MGCQGVGCGVRVRVRLRLTAKRIGGTQLWGSFGSFFVRNFSGDRRYGSWKGIAQLKHRGLGCVAARWFGSSWKLSTRLGGWARLGSLGRG